MIPNPDDVILIKTLFSHPGWIKYEECLNRDIEFLDSEINKLTNGVTIFNEDNIELLRQLTILRRAIKIKLLHKEELLDEIKNPLEEDNEVQSNFSASDTGAQ